MQLLELVAAQHQAWEAADDTAARSHSQGSHKRDDMEAAHLLNSMILSHGKHILNSLSRSRAAGLVTAKVARQTQAARMTLVAVA